MNTQLTPDEQNRYSELAARAENGEYSTLEHAHTASAAEEAELDALLADVDESRIDHSAPTPAAPTEAITADDVRKVVRGRHSLGAAQHRGTSPKRQVRLPIELDRALTERAERDHTNRSDIMREALTRYLVVEVQQTRSPSASERSAVTGRKQYKKAARARGTRISKGSE